MASVVKQLRNKERRELEFALHINQTQDRVTVQDRLVDAARKSGGSLNPNRKPQRSSGKTAVFSQSSKFQKVKHPPGYLERRSSLMRTKTKSVMASARFGAEAELMSTPAESDGGVVDGGDMVVGAPAGGVDAQGGANETGGAGNITGRRGLVLSLEQRQSQNLSTLRKNVNLPKIKHLLPAYDGDKFSTGGNYWQGQLYMARMTPAKEHIRTNRFNFHQEETPRYVVKDLKKVDLDSKRNTCRSVCNLTWHASNASAIIKEGGLSALQNMARSDLDESIQIQCAIAFHNLARIQDVRQAMIEHGIVTTIAKALGKQSHAPPVVLMHYLAAMAALSCSKFERGIEAKMLQEGALEILQVTGKGLSDSSASMKGRPVEPISLANMLGARIILNLTTCFDERTTYDHAVELITECISRLTQYLSSSVKGITAVTCMLVQALCNISRYENNRARMISQGVVGMLVKSWKTAHAGAAPSGDLIALEHAMAALILILSNCKGELRVTMIRQKAVQLLDAISSPSSSGEASAEQDKHELTATATAAAAVKLSNEMRQRCAQALGNLASGGHGDGRSATSVLPAILKLSKNLDAATREKCARALKDMSERPFSRKLILDQGVVAILSRLLDAEHVHNPNPTKVKVDCLCAICNLLVFPNTQIASVKDGAVDVLLTTFERGAGRAEKLCCMTMQCLLTVPDAREYVTNKRTLRMLSHLMMFSKDKSVVYQVTATLAGLVARPDTAKQILELENLDVTPIKAFLLMVENYDEQKIQQAALAALSFLSRVNSSVCHEIAEHGAEIVIGVITGTMLGDAIPTAPGEELESRGSAIMVSTAYVELNTRLWCSMLLCELSSHIKLRPALIASGICAALSILAKTDNALVQSCVSRSFCHLSDCEGGVSTTSTVVASGAVTSLIALSSAHDESTRSNCSRALCNLTWGADIHAARQIVAAGTVNELMILALVRSDSPATKLTCLTALANLLDGGEMLEAMVEQGLVWAMTMASTLETSDESAKDRLREEGLALVAAVYSVLVRSETGCNRLISERGGVRAVARLIGSNVAKTSKSGWEVLRIMCKRECQQRLIDEGCLEVLVDMKRQSALTPKEDIAGGGGDESAPIVTHNLSALIAFLLRSDDGRSKLAAEAISMLPSISNSEGGSAETARQTRCYAAEVVCRLASDERTCSIFVARGGLNNISSLVRGVTNQAMVPSSGEQAPRSLSAGDPYTTSMLTLALLKTSMHKENAKVMVESGCVFDIEALSHSTDVAILEKLVAIIRSLSWRPSDHDNLVHEHHVIRVLRSIFDRAPTTDAMRLDCADAICNLSYHISPGSYEDMVSDGAIELLVLLAEACLEDESSAKQNGATESRNGGNREVSSHNTTKLRVAISFCHLASGGFGERLIDLDVIPVILKIILMPHCGLELRRDCLSTLCSLSFCFDTRGEEMIEAGVYDVVTRLSRSSDVFLRKCCGTILSNLSSHAVNGVQGSVAALLDLCMPVKSDSAGDEEKETTTHDTDFRSRTLQRKNSGSIMSAESLDRSSAPPGDWGVSWENWLELNSHGSDIPQGIEIRFREQHDDGSSGRDGSCNGNGKEGNSEDRGWVNQLAGPPVGGAPTMPDPPAAPSLEDMGNPSMASMASTLSSILVDISEPKDDGVMRSPLRAKKNSSEDHAHFEGAEYRLEKDSHGVRWLDPTTASLWPLEELPGAASSVGMEGSDLGNARAGEVAAFATNPSSVSFVLYCVIVFIWFFCFTFFL
jgi:hypothetical protein